MRISLHADNHAIAVRILLLGLLSFVSGLLCHRVAGLVVDAEVDVVIVGLADVARVAALRTALEFKELLRLGKKEVPLLLALGPSAEDEGGGGVSPLLRRPDLDEVPGAGLRGQVPR